MSNIPTTRIAFLALLAELPACCSECRDAPGSPQRKQAANLVHALAKAGVLAGTRYEGPWA